MENLLKNLLIKHFARKYETFIEAFSGGVVSSVFKFILFLKLRWSHNATIFTQEYIEEYYKKSLLFIRDLMLKNVQKQQNCTDIFMFDLLKL